MSIRQSLLEEKAFTFANNFFYHKSFEQTRAFEKTYVTLREQEGRVYSDEIVKKLPIIESGHPLNLEWKIRRKSTDRLCAYIRNSKPKTILEVGCGNGWLSNQLQLRTNCEVLGIDVNETELLQAARIFSRPDLTFAGVDIFNDVNIPPFDIIVLASCIQYFPNVRELIHKLKLYLKPNGTIHIIDSPIYLATDISRAQMRTSEYFRQFNIHDNSFYFHHSWGEFADIQFEILYNPVLIINKLKKLVSPISPFPWILIRK
jgi:2-polyprenyl-3-methyl-5-hydroxy-6-metoxy-1,4-benzoquinol methylase